MNPLAEFDTQQLRTRPYITGVDEAGRGALAGPVSAAAFVAKADFYSQNNELFDSINDSKKLSPEKRLEIFKYLGELKEQNIVDFECAFSSVEEIEQLNILKATAMAMEKALRALNGRLNLNYKRNAAALTLFGESAVDTAQSEIFIDGKPIKNFEFKHRAIVKGDATCMAIAAASIVAKVSRDLFMDEMGKKYKHYGFEQHKGYGTELHCERIKELGRCPIHRLTFVKTMLSHDKKEDPQGELF